MHTEGIIPKGPKARIVKHAGKQYELVSQERCLHGLCTLRTLSAAPTIKVVPCRDVTFPGR